MKIHPAVPHLQDAETQDDIFKASHQLTVELETIKKKIAHKIGGNNTRVKVEVRNADNRVGARSERLS